MEEVPVRIPASWAQVIRHSAQWPWMTAKGASAAAYRRGAERQQKQQAEGQDEPFFRRFIVLAPFCSLGFMFIVYKKKAEGSIWIG